jgi:hypothetical protein
MAGPKNGFMAGRQLVTIFAPNGEEFQTTRPNALDMIRTSGYSWTKEDAGKARIELDGPEDPTANVVVIYDLEGNPLEVEKRNARELVRSGKYKWTTNGVTEEEAAQAVVDAVEALAEAEAKQESEATPAESLTEEAERVTGEADVEAYLTGFSLEALKSMASERYGESIHHRASKETAIAKIVELEEARQLAD